ncbi:chloride channel protein [Limnobacter humi]|uniref:Chloride channel protein n=1 Tax=Limnobacter humi TaxID=1778671 RepID=A0ABT1WBK9_9BURK|nr:chloride channel protein [Limnobacter humi]MCQ8894900.1 chloride channel protein [Limnobacter humi]
MKPVANTHRATPSITSSHAATTDGLTVSPSLDLVLESEHLSQQPGLLDKRTISMSGLAILLGLAASGVAWLMLKLIAIITNLAFYGHFQAHDVSPADAVAHLGWWVLPIPVVGAVLIGLMARYGSKAIRGHGIPEAMEQVLTNRSRIPARVMFLKPISSAISIGTGGPFGAEGPIIATGSALGSFVGQKIPVSTAERKTLLAAGAAAGMSAIFGSPVSAVLIAIELLLFEYRPRSIIPVALAAVTAAGMRIVMEGSEPIFAMPELGPPGLGALVFYTLLGAVMGLAAAGVTRIVYGIEDTFERLPIHWMWWPALGALAVGVAGYFAPDTLGVGYYNIRNILSDGLAWQAVAVLIAFKFFSWSISLGSGTSGGTLAPLFTLGGGLGLLLGKVTASVLPMLHIDVRVAALVGMAALFAGASRALLTSAVFAFETTLQPMGLLPLLGGCAAAYLVSSLVMRNTIMTEKIARRGVRTPAEYSADPLEQVLVHQVANQQVMRFQSGQQILDVVTAMRSDPHAYRFAVYPVVDAEGRLKGVVDRDRILTAIETGQVACTQGIESLIAQRPRFVFDDMTVRHAVQHMVKYGLDALPVLSRQQRYVLVGVISHTEISIAYRHGLED